jgi:hypothetical protein
MSKYIEVKTKKGRKLDDASRTCQKFMKTRLYDYASVFFGTSLHFIYPRGVAISKSFILTAV